MLDPTINEKVWDFLISGGIFMAFIAGCSFVGIAVCIHRSLTLRWKTIIPMGLRTGLARCGEGFREGRATPLFLELKGSDSVVGRVGSVALSPEFTTREDAMRAVEATAREQMVKLENGMGVLEVVITISPLLGLLGTVSGLVTIFASLGGTADSAESTIIAAGIAVALNTTVAGLVVAVIMVIFHSHFTRRLERIAARLEVISEHLLHEFYKHGGPALYIAEESKVGNPEAELTQAIHQSGLELGNSNSPLFS